MPQLIIRPKWQLHSGFQGRYKDPAWLGTKVAEIAVIVIAGRDVVKGGSNPIQSGINETDWAPELLIDQSDKGGPQWRNGAGSSDYSILSINHDEITGGRVGISGDVGNTAPYKARLRPCWNAC